MLNELHLEGKRVRTLDLTRKEVDGAAEENMDTQRDVSPGRRKGNRAHVVKGRGEVINYSM